MNETMLDPEWRAKNCKLTWGGFLCYWTVPAWMFLEENYWKWLLWITVFPGIALSKGVWRRVLAATLWLLLMTFGHPRTDEEGCVGWKLGVVWFACLCFVWYRDGQDAR